MNKKMKMSDFKKFCKENRFNLYMKTIHDNSYFHRSDIVLDEININPEEYKTIFENILDTYYYKNEFGKYKNGAGMYVNNENGFFIFYTKYRGELKEELKQRESEIAKRIEIAVDKPIDEIGWINYRNKTRELIRISNRVSLNIKKYVCKI